MLVRRSWLLALTFALAACAPNALHNNQTAPTTIAPDLSERAIAMLPVSAELATIPVRLNGEGRYRFVLDTGATPTALFGNPRLDPLALELTGDFPVTGVGTGKGARASIASAVDVGIGGVEIRGMTPVYMTWQNLPFFHSPETVFWDGVIGYDLYSRVAVDVDPIARTVRLYPPGSDFADLTAGAVTVPLTVAGTSSFVHAEVRTRADAPAVPVKLHVDTGKRDALSLIVQRHPSFAAPEQARVTTTVGVSGSTVNRVSRIDSLDLHGITLGNVDVAYVDESSGAFTHDADGRIGAGLLNRFRYIVDYPGRQLILVPNETSGEDQRRVPEAGLRLLAIGDEFDALVVVRAEPPAQAAGVRDGDIVVSIDGVAATELARGKWPALLRDKRVGDRLTVCLRAEPQPRCRDVVLESGL